MVDSANSRVQILGKGAQFQRVKSALSCFSHPVEWDHGLITVQDFTGFFVSGRGERHLSDLLCFEGAC